MIIKRKQRIRGKKYGQTLVENVLHTSVTHWGYVESSRCNSQEACSQLCQILQMSTKFMSGNVIFTWTPSNYSYYDVQLTTNIKKYPWTRVSDAQFTVMDALLYDSITIDVRTPGSKTNNRKTYNVSEVQTQTGSTEAVSWTAAFFPLAGQYQVYHTYSDNRTIFSISRSGVSYGTKNISTKYTYITRPFASTNITFEIKDISLDDAGYYNGGTSAEAAWSGGGVVLIVKNRPLKPTITGNLDVEETKYISLTCSIQSTSAPDYYSKLVTLFYTWFVNDTKINGETRETLRLYVTRDHKYNRYSCTATEEGLESERSDPVYINPLYVSTSERLSISPRPTLSGNDKLVVKEGDTVGPFSCSADCNPACDVTWVLRISGRFMDASVKDGMLLPLVVNRNMELVRCVARGKLNNETISLGIWLDVQYLDNPTLYVNDVLKSNGEINENMTLKISCHVDGNPAPQILLSRGQADTEVLERRGSWLNYTIKTTQCINTDTYKCIATSAGFGSSEKTFNISVFCNPRIDDSFYFEPIYFSKSGNDVTLNVAIPFIANPPPTICGIAWDGHTTLPIKAVIANGCSIYKHWITFFIPVYGQTCFGNYSLKYNGKKITTITIKEDETLRGTIDSIEKQTENEESCVRKLLKKRKLDKIVTHYVKDKKNIEEIVEEEEFIYEE